MLEIKLHFQNTLRYPILTMTKNIQKNLLELKLKTSRTNAPTATIIGDRMIKKVLVTNCQDSSTRNTML